MTARRIPPRDPKAPNALWTYYQEGFPTPVQGHSRAHLLDNILKFRLSNNLEIGDPEEDYENYIRHKFPGFARPQPMGEDADEMAGIRKATIRSNLDEVRLTNKLWLKRDAEQAKRGKQLERVRQDEATTRAQICASCRSNVAVKEVTHCAPCVTQLDRDSLILSNNAKTSTQEPLRFCSSLLHDNRVAIWMPSEALERSRRKITEETPAECWVRAL